MLLKAIPTYTNSSTRLVREFGLRFDEFQSTPQGQKLGALMFIGVRVHKDGEIWPNANDPNICW